MMRKKNRYWLVACLGLLGCTSPDEIVIQLENPSGTDRQQELVEIRLEELPALSVANEKAFKLMDENQQEIPFQLTHNGLLVFPASLKGGEKANYRLTRAKHQPFDTIACGRCYPERLDDIAWENDKSAYRAYGPALQKSGERGFGYDILTKSVPYPVVAERYKKELDPASRAEMKRLREKGCHAQADSIGRAISYHIDHGNGMDCYNVGATLGGGTAALMEESSLVYPYCYERYRILDNGPLRFTVELTYPPAIVGKDSNVVETRLITLDAGSYLNKTTLRYQHLSAPKPLATGIVIHPQNQDGAHIIQEKGILAYADSTNNVKAGNGIIYVGIIPQSQPEWTGIKWFTPEESQAAPGALGHVLAISTYEPDKAFVYYWGSTWSKNDCTTAEEWNALLLKEYEKIHSPLRSTIKK